MHCKCMLTPTLFGVSCRDFFGHSKEHQWRLNMPNDDSKLKTLDELMALAGENAMQVDLPGALELLA